MSLIQAMAMLKAVFDKYAGKDGDRSTLTKAEISDLLRNELLGDAASSQDVDKFFSMLDGDKDSTVDFKEYVLFVASLSIIMNQCPQK